MRKWEKGLEYEKQCSVTIHSLGIPVLISPVVLRKRGAGQIDLAIYQSENQKIIVYEVKHEDAWGLSRGQYKRLKKSVDWIAQILQVQVGLRFRF
ncbi:MAG: hypothetical protein H6621_01635 [Halobacteriovoraceae bacterium]|nr:hypothetical protein [Halobacteriovoraceae bacterium]